MQLADSLGLGLLGRYLGSRLRSNRLSLTPHFGCGFGSALCHCGLLSCTSASQALLHRRGFRLFLLPLLPPPLCLAHLFSASTHVVLLGCLGQTLGEPRRELCRLDFSCAVAQSIGCLPSLFFASSATPSECSHCTTPRWPLLHAQWIGCTAPLSLASSATPSECSHCTISRWPPEHAMWIGCTPWSSFR